MDMGIMGVGVSVGLVGSGELVYGREGTAGCVCWISGLDREHGSSVLGGKGI